MQPRTLPAQSGNKILKSIAAFTLTVIAASASAQVAGAYKVTNLVSDGSVPATTTDAGFINPWAISSSGTWWISAQGSGQNYVVPSTTNLINFKVVVPFNTGVTTTTGLPAGSVTTAGSTGMLLSNNVKASFLFSTLDGTISGWNSGLGTAGAISRIAINNAAAGASYPGLAIINTATASYILAPNFGTGNAIEIYDGTFAKTTLPGTFKDPTLPANYAPFSVHVLNGKVYVAYALRTAAAPFRTVDAVGNGAVSVFDLSGNFIARVATGGNLDSPWGVAFAPASFGVFGGSLLIGNFGNGLINAYDPVTFAWRGQLTDNTGKPLTYASLWELLPGGTTVGNTTTVSGGDVNTVYFTAGLTGELHGLFAAISNDTTAGTAAFGVSSSIAAATVTAGSSVQAIISIAPHLRLQRSRQAGLHRASRRSQLLLRQRHTHSISHSPNHHHRHHPDLEEHRTPRTSKPPRSRHYLGFAVALWFATDLLPQTSVRELHSASPLHHLRNDAPPPRRDRRMLQRLRCLTSHSPRNLAGVYHRNRRRTHPGSSHLSDRAVTAVSVT